MIYQLTSFSRTRFQLRSAGVTTLAFAFVIGLSSVVQGGAIRTGFDSNTLARNDDQSTDLESIGFGVNFFGTVYDQLYVNNNGNVTFDFALSTFTPFPLVGTNRIIIAPFFADVDTGGPGEPVTYGQDTVDGRAAFGVNYIDVAHYSQSLPLNSFQLVLIDRSDIATGDFDIEFNYDSILWESGEASGSDSNGLGGFAARAGLSNGSNFDLELPGSAINGAFLDSGPASTSLIQNSLNSQVDGRYIFNVRNGDVNPGVVPEPTSALIFAGIALCCGGTNLRRRRKLPVKK